jgi:hypothetical protein
VFLLKKHPMIKKLLYPFELFSCGPGQIFSPLDAIAEQGGVKIVEEFFRNCAAAKQTSRAFQLFLDDDEAERALKKGYHAIFEKRLRNRALVHDSAEKNYFDPVKVSRRPQPLDIHAENELRHLSGRKLPPLTISTIDKLRHFLAVFLWGLVLLGSLIAIPVVHGMGRGKQYKCKVALPNQGSNSVLEYLRGGAKKYGLWKPNTIITVLENPIHVPPLEDIPTIHPRQLKVPPKYWLQTMVPAVTIMCIHLYTLLFINFRDPRITTLIGECFHLAVLALKLIPIAANMKVDSYLDSAEYNPIHNIKGILFRRFGTGALVRLPHSQIDTRGSSLSFLGYDVFYSSGPYQYDEYGDTWSPRTQKFITGAFRNDDYFMSTETIAPNIQEVVDRALKGGKKIIALFGTSSVEGLKGPTNDVLQVLLELVLQRDDIFLLVKPKGKGRDDWMGPLLRSFGYYSGHLDGKVYVVDYSETDIEICPSGWVVRKMSFGVSFGGSIAIEALSAGKTSLLYYPVSKRTRYEKELSRRGMIFSTVSDFETGLHALLDKVQLPKSDYAWFQEQFDPYGDDQALARFLSAILCCENSDKVMLQTPKQISGKTH